MRYQQSWSTPPDTVGIVSAGTTEGVDDKRYPRVSRLRFLDIGFSLVKRVGRRGASPEYIRRGLEFLIEIERTEVLQAGVV